MSNRLPLARRTLSHRLGTLGLAIAASAALAEGCVQTRPARNAVLNENQYIRKDFLTVPAGSSQPDPGWFLLGTIVQTSTPNPLGGAFTLSPGISSAAVPVRFVITSDKVQMVSTREEAATDAQSTEVTPAVVNAWPAQSVDLEYYVNLDGELTNQYVVNQEAPWQQREWVQLNFDKNDMSDLAPLGEGQWNVLSHCVDSANVSATLVPGSFLVDEANNYLQWTVSVTLPLIWDDPTCFAAYGELGKQALALGKQSVTMNLMYSLMRQKPLASSTYQPLSIAEKDGIQHKYGLITTTTENVDPATNQLAGQTYVTRFDPTKPIVWYFAQGFDPAYKSIFTQDGGIVDRTNDIFVKANVPTRIVVREYDDPTGLAPGQGPRQYGDIRYNFLVWMSDEFSQAYWAGVTIGNYDYRTGEILSSTIAFNKFFVEDYYIQRIDSYLAGVGAEGSAIGDAGLANVNSPTEWPTVPVLSDASKALNCSSTMSTGSCPISIANADGTTTTLYCAQSSTVPIQSVVDAAVHNGTSTVFGKMQAYMGLPVATSGNLGPQDFIAPPSKTNDADFLNAYYALLPYTIYADPAANAWTIPEGGNGVFGPPSIWADLQNEVAFQTAAQNINKGSGLGWPYLGASGAPSLQEAAAGAQNFKALTLAHKDYLYHMALRDNAGATHLDGIDSLAFENVADQAGRACGVDGTPGQWQTKEQWQADAIQAYWNAVEFHEFGHSLGLQHNFMASIDARNFPAYAVGTTPQATCDANPLAAGCVPTQHSSSIMEYNSEIDRVAFRVPTWGPYDQAAIGWIYSNNSVDGTPPGGAPCSPTATGPVCSISGQVTKTQPWNDVLGFNADGTEKQFLMCYEPHMKYTPFCRQGDLGRTPSEIVANALDSYEWNYQWRNHRSYHKFWDDSNYASSPAGLFGDIGRFLPVWAFDWSGTELAVTLRKIGIKNPDPTMQSDNDYFTQLTNKFNAEISAANQMAVAYHVAMINQAQDERPAASAYDPFYGDVTQQGIILDKFIAMEYLAGLFPIDNFDQNQAAGAYLSYYEGIGDAPFNTLSQWAVVTTLGGVPNVFPYFQPTSVALFAQDTHSGSFANPPIRNWSGGFAFGREQDFLAYFQNIAVQKQWTGNGCVNPNAQTQVANASDGGFDAGFTEEGPSVGAAIPCDCLTTETCTYDPRNIADPQQLNQFIGPDGRRYIWAYVPDRNEWVVAEHDTNIVTSLIVSNYNSDVIAQQDDGNFPGGAFGVELPIKYIIDSFLTWN